MLVPANTRTAAEGATDLAWAAVVALVLTAGFYAAFAGQGIDLADEGFLLYGVQRTLAGEVPLRDFQSYEPGRYYWCAAWCAGVGQGFLGLRGALAVFQALSLFCGLLVARRAVPSRWFLLPIGIVLLAWMFPLHRVFECGFAMMSVLAALWLLERPSLRRHFVVGGFTGLAACFGRNFGLYTAVGTGALVLVMALRAGKGPHGHQGAHGTRVPLARRGAVWSLGILLGFTPLLGMMIFVPGFAGSFYDSIVFFVEKGVNLPLPYPWPWRLGYETFRAPERVAVACAFLLPIVAHPIGIVLGFLAPEENSNRRAACIAASFVGVAYAHQVVVRSDAEHLAGCIQPAMLAVLALPRALGFERRILPTAAISGFLLLMTLLAAPAVNPHLARLRPGADLPELVTREIAGDPLRLDPTLAGELDEMQRLFSIHVPTEERYVFMAPSFSAFYPILGKISPVWEIYFLWPGEPGRQVQIIGELEEKRVRWVYIVETAVDDRPENMFQNTHPLVWRYLLDAFERIPTPRLFPNHYLLRRRAGA